MSSSKFHGKDSQSLGRLDMMEKTRKRSKDCKSFPFMPISKQFPFRIWILTAFFCSLACITIVCATIWACGVAGIGQQGNQQSAMIYDDDMPEDILNHYITSRRRSDINPKPDNFNYKYGERYKENFDLDTVSPSDEKQDHIGHLKSAKNLSTEVKKDTEETKVNDDRHSGVRGRFGIKERAKERINFSPNKNRAKDESILKTQTSNSELKKDDAPVKNDKELEIVEEIKGIIRNVSNENHLKANENGGRDPKREAGIKMFKSVERLLIGDLVNSVGEAILEDSLRIIRNGVRADNGENTKTDDAQNGGLIQNGGYLQNGGFLQYPSVAVGLPAININQSWTNEKSENLTEDSNSNLKSSTEKVDSIYAENFPEEYGLNDYFYSELDAESYYADYEESTWTDFIMGKMQELHEWLSTDFKTRGGVSKGSPNNTLPQLISSLNRSVSKGDVTIFLLKLKDMYYNKDSMMFNVTESRELLTNTTNPASFGLLAVDVLLLRNLLLLSWDDQDTAAREVLNDPELFAMNALFMDPEEVKKLYEDFKEKRKLEKNTDGDETPSYDNVQDTSSVTSNFYGTSDVGRDLAHFAFSTLRAAVNLGRVFWTSRSESTETSSNNSKKENSKEFLTTTEINGPENQEKITQLDCLWIVYCRNLIKAANRSGIYGFLAKLNSLGLKLMTGELPRQAMNQFVTQVFRGGSLLNCEEIFPKCKDKNASSIVLDGIIGKKNISLP